MERNLGKIIRDRRKELGWDQAELARALGDIKQQTVSRWERGASRPRSGMVGRLAEILGTDPQDLAQAAGYTAAEPPPRPVRPRVPSLPLAELSPDRFEQFMTDLADLLYRDAEAHRFGAQGHKQSGVDVIVRQGKTMLATFQCKRRKQFGPADVQAAVEAAQISARKHYLALTRVASPEARMEMSKHKNWELWDREDISRVVRSRLPLDAALRLVDTYFPGWREPFLGVREPGPWLTTEEYFQPFGGEQLFSHDWTLIGRREILQQAGSFLAGEKKLALLLGRGGLGKTRLLRGIAQQAERAGATEVRFVATGTEVKPEHFELLPRDGRLVLIVDDAQDRSDISELILGVGHANPDAKFILALRPYGMTQLANDLRRVGIHPSELPTWELEDLKSQDAQALAQEILGPEFDQIIAERLGRLTTDCPLITVIGAGLIRRGLLDPSRLESNEAIRTEILRAFRDALIAATGDPELRRAVLDAVAVLQPVRADSPVFRTAFEQLAGAPFDRIIRHLNGLEDGGLLLRRGSSLRIAPDLLGDVVLAEACFDSRFGVSTGYLERIHQAVEGEPLQHVFVNASRVDWQVRQDQAGPSSFVEPLWEALEVEFRAAGIGGRLGLLRLLKKVAYFQPERALSLVRWALEHPTDFVESADHVLARLYRPSYDDVIREIPGLLRLVAYNIEYLPEAIDLLWTLARDDQRPTNQYPDHPIRVLTDLAEFGIGKPLAFNEVVIEAARRWLADDHVHEWPYSPFDVLEALLATEGSDHSSDGVTIQFRPYALNATVVQRLREPVLQLAFDEAKSTHPRRAVRAIEAIGSSLHYPSGLFGRPVSEAERDKWTPTFVDTIRRLGDLGSSEDIDPVMAVAIRRTLDWHAEYSPTATQQAAREALERLPTSIEHELALALYDGWGELLFGHLEDFEEAERRKRDRFQTLAESIVGRYSDRETVDLLTEQLAAQREAFRESRANAGPFIWVLVGIKPSIGALICRRVVSDPSSPLLGIVPVVLSQLAETRPASAIKWARTLIVDQPIEVVRTVAHAFGWGRGRRRLLNGELRLLREFAQHPDAYVRRSAASALRFLVDESRHEALELASQIRFDDSKEVAEELLSMFGPRGGLSWSYLSPAQAQLMLDQLRSCPSIDDYHITEFLSELSREYPEEVLELLRDRVERSESNRRIAEYRALPYRWDTPLQVRNHPLFVPLLREIRNWIAANLDSWQRQKMGAELFRAVAGNFDDQVIELLDEAFASGEQTQTEAAAAILHEAPRSLVWERVDFVRRALSAGAKHGQDCMRRVGGGLHAAVVSGTRSGTPGQPFSEDVEQREKAARIAAELPNGSFEQRFYESLAKSAEENIRWQAEEDEKLMDGREW